MTFVDAIKSVLSKYATFRGVAPRSEYWYFYLFTVLVSVVTTTLDSVLASAGVAVDESGMSLGSLNGLTSLALLLPTLAVTARRIRDAGHTQKWWLLQAVPVALFFVAIVQLVTNPEALRVLTDLAQNSGLAVSQDENYFASLINGLIGVLIYFMPTLLAALGVSIWWLIMTLKPTKTFEQGNKYVGPSSSSAPAAPSQSTDY